ncbi:hypothetical protein DGN16_02995 [Xanthomonas citri pv. fuscans]|nr:methylenetetrahydrofolate reductase C-terminal domain-containing protein [Xanthomonas citri pv. phaseoli var. fuscans]QTL01251.1 methylenetetrahydrofolate reductase C-terminal domain-containing protein [Xanthomonas citri pv. fuscans]QTH26194.1 methylenetetrahydrofolate reductase C-terminal domain-containing protein [Xanthomonas citri pv. phaseoli var. fuscans]QTJ31051.1 methylenetetrahydrofolate reductase C-terminal domain-containing protein [Xanthomonas citri pv. phaseoli var. fuscans]QTJ31
MSYRRRSRPGERGKARTWHRPCRQCGRCGLSFSAGDCAPHRCRRRRRLRAHVGTCVRGCRHHPD